ncbi:hypothetical protein D1816_12410 [Aquimarina sp. AD10]|nr:hypothetical protein D1816_12410 [Aquimarina sp. AD10]
MLRNVIENNMLTNVLIYTGILLLGLGAVLAYYTRKPYVKMISQDIWEINKYPVIMIPYKEHKKKNPKVEVIEILGDIMEEYINCGVNTYKNHDVKISCENAPSDLRIEIK